MCYNRTEDKGFSVTIALQRNLLTLRNFTTSQSYFNIENTMVESDISPLSPITQLKMNLIFLG